MEYRWIEKQLPDPQAVERLQKSLNVSAVIATLLIQRGVHDYEEAFRFFRPSLKQLHDPFLMKDMDKAVRRIEQAIASDEKILVYGDYDVDGTTAVSLMYLFLKELYPHVETYIPDRYAEGYGVSYQGIDFASQHGFSLVIALDCGIKAIDKIAYAATLGIDFIVCDHHRPSDELPKAVAVLNAKRTDCEYPYKELCGCGVGFKLIHAIVQKRNWDIDLIYKYLDFVSVAIAADIVPMTGENRIMMHYGLRVLNEAPSVGLQALLGSEKNTPVTVTDVVFGVAPRINAAGRMEHGLFAVNLLTEKDSVSARLKAKEIEEFNNSRKEYDSSITQEALLQIEKKGEQNNASTVVFNPDWHKGVIGIVASRLIETYYRPTLVFTQSGEKYAASARSVKGFDVYEALEKCSEYIEQFGGHKYAAGLTVAPENFSVFKNKFEEVVAETLSSDLQIPQIQIDACLPLEAIRPNMWNLIKQFEPFGPQNLSPVFLAKNVVDSGHAKCIGLDNKHLRMFLRDAGGKQYFPAIAFGLAGKKHLVSSEKPFDIAYSIEENHWNGKMSLQLKIRDIRVSQ
ncbi:MAG: single-stranded-DNA-specific exonuclease RecJ [Capnocytophaga sp.]|nr:single-stranded-DNA-specific exonuclease RecJ [Capnocytophaga sp.]